MKYAEKKRRKSEEIAQDGGRRKGCGGGKSGSLRKTEGERDEESVCMNACR